MIFSPFIYINKEFNLQKINKINKTRKNKIKAITLGYIHNLNDLENQLQHIQEFTLDNLLTLSIGTWSKNDLLLQFLSSLINLTKCYKLDFTFEYHDFDNINKLNTVLFQLQQKHYIYISYTIPIVNCLHPININLIHNIINNNIINFNINAMLMNLYNIDNNFKWLDIIQNMIIQLSISKLIGICLLLGKQEEDYVFNIIDINNITTFALKKNLHSISYLNVDPNLEYYDIIYNIIYPHQNHKQIYLNWNYGENYNINDIVIYKSIKYKCIKKHTSILTWNPSKTINIWIKI